jgi:hypothetical protein
MGDNVNIVLEKIKSLPTIKSGKKSIITLSSNEANLSAEEFNEAAEYIWDNNLVKILKVERDHSNIVRIYADVTA